MRCGCAGRRGRGARATADAAARAAAARLERRHGSRERGEPAPRATGTVRRDARPCAGTMGSVVVVPPNKAAVISGVGGTKFADRRVRLGVVVHNNADYLDPALVAAQRVSSRRARDGRGREAECGRGDAGEGGRAFRLRPRKAWRAHAQDKGNLKLACQHFRARKTKAVQESLTATMGKGTSARCSRYR